MPEARFDSLLSVVAGVVGGFDETRGENWQSQLQFLRTSDGAEYIVSFPQGCVTPGSLHCYVQSSAEVDEIER